MSAIVLSEEGDKATTMAKCFVIMPISMPDIYADRYNDQEHFKHVLDYLFIPALEAAGYETVPPTIAGSDLIHAEIIGNLETCDLVLCDISTLNPNVFFELGIRTSLDRPAALVRDNFTAQIPFDTGSINTHMYDASLRPWKLPSEVQTLTLHIQEVTARSDNRNALWRYFGLTQRASPAEIRNPTEAKLDLLIDEVTRLARRPDIVSSSPAPISDRGFLYEMEIESALTGMGYRAVHVSRKEMGGFSLIVEDESGRRIYAELKRLPRPIRKEIVDPIIVQASEISAPVLLITNTGLSALAREAVEVSGKLKVVEWRDGGDNDQLAEMLSHMFASIPAADT
jgi:hypothetical protein